MNKVSIIITTYKRPDTLRRAIISAATQSYSNIEVIVVNDNGVDSPQNLITRSIVNELSKHFTNIKYIEHNENKNGAAARNTGIHAATGEYLTFLDDDDIFSGNRIETLVPIFQKDSNAHLVYSAVGFAQGNKITRLLYPVDYDDHVYQLLRQKSFFGTGSNFLCKTDLVRDIGGFNEFFKRHQDMEFLIRYLTKYPNVFYVKKVLVVKTVASASNAPGFLDFLEIKKFFLEEFKELIQKYSVEEQNEIRRANAREVVSTAGINRDWRLLSLLKSGETLFGACKSERANHLLKWLIFQIPGVRELLGWRTMYRARLADRKLGDSAGMRTAVNIITGIDDL